MGKGENIQPSSDSKQNACSHSYRQKECVPAGKVPEKNWTRNLQKRFVLNSSTKSSDHTEAGSKQTKYEAMEVRTRIFISMRYYFMKLYNKNIAYILDVVLQLRRIGTGFSQQRYGFIPW
jgi:hypothetical protein